MRLCAMRQAMVLAGATLIDVGGESTRPGRACCFSQRRKNWSVLRRLSSASARELDVIISVDTSTPVVMTEVARLGCGLDQ
jgi:dihydropteroate synthase